MTGWILAGLGALTFSALFGVVVGKWIAGPPCSHLHEGATMAEHNDPITQAWTAPVVDLGSLDYGRGES